VAIEDGGGANFEKNSSFVLVSGLRQCSMERRSEGSEMDIGSDGCEGRRGVGIFKEGFGISKFRSLRIERDREPKLSGRGRTDRA